jgi:hypothetical protein
MVDKNKVVTQLAERFDAQSAVALTDKQKLSIYKKSQKSGYPVDILEEVYRRGILTWNESTNQTPEQIAFGRVNSFIAGGMAAEMDKDLTEKEVWDEPNPKKKSEKLSSADKAAAKARAARAGRKYPNLVDNMWAAQRNEETCAEPQSSNPNDSSSRFIGTDSLVDIYMKNTPGQSKTLKAIKDVVREAREPLLDINEAEYKGKKVTLNKPFRTPGGPKKSAVYVDPDGDGKAKIVRFGDPNLSIKKHRPARKRSYCARSSGQGNLTDKGSANYWSRKAWDC